MVKKLSKDTALKFDHIFKLMNFDCSLCAYENKDNKGWVYALQILTRKSRSKNNKNECYDVKQSVVAELKSCLFEVYSQKTYATFKDALQDGYGILEYLGFVVQDKKTRARFNILSWDNGKKDFVENVVYFDGYDFFETM